MQISPPSSNQPLQALLPNNTSAAGSQGSQAHASGTSTAAAVSSTPPNDAKDTAESTQVTLSATQQTRGNAPEFAPVFAEIWKQGIKVAEIDIYGGVNPVNGLVAPIQGTVGSGGALLAARRAVEIARSVGGEIRVGGQIMDSQTLDMRARLKVVYGI